MTEDLDNMIPKLAFDRFTDLANFLTEGCSLKFRNHRAFAKPAQIATICTGAGILRVSFGNGRKINATGEEFVGSLGFYIRLYKNMSRPNLLFGAGSILGNFIRQFLT